MALCASHPHNQHPVEGWEELQLILGRTVAISDCGAEGQRLGVGEVSETDWSKELRRLGGLGWGLTSC